MPSPGKKPYAGAKCQLPSHHFVAGKAETRAKSKQKGRASRQESRREEAGKTGNVKNGGGEMHHTSISPVSAPLLSAQNGISLLKEISFLPQRREFLAAKKSRTGREAGKNGASDTLFTPIRTRRADKTGLTFRKPSRANGRHPPAARAPPPAGGPPKRKRFPPKRDILHSPNRKIRAFSRTPPPEARNTRFSRRRA